MRYDNANGFPVIEDDDRDPWVSFRHHRARGSAGGVDLVATYGTTLRAPCRSVVGLIPWDGTGGNTIRFWHLDEDGRRTGAYDEYLHLSRFLVPAGTVVDYGQPVALSGASGVLRGERLLWRYAPHLHWHHYEKVGGPRLNPWDYFRGIPITTLPNTYTPIEEDDVSFGEEIPWRDGKQPAWAVIQAGAINAELAVAKADLMLQKQDVLLARLGQLDLIQHRDVSAPLDVVLADLLTGVQNTERRVGDLQAAQAANPVPSAVG
ncbi:M23 family metallopeptidase [Rathayibacter sp. VKM Ac-2927]|uniref:M23 family metallopeptidase n=1 Tax=Rathayibacter sp. VKM Ac-2927 TaxID=2929478 RepID=UPI001FB36C23|nr:M23 family metallopeptidase [Rathayibacter sp. VKM Ac-2927]MCJ1687793.1 M23 family metallopeptidase [Rathayibacter sp. VKM Ac-2927]